MFEVETALQSEFLPGLFKAFHGGELLTTHIGKYLVWVFHVMLSSLMLSEMAHCLKVEY